ncbi:hypothetical protein WJX84_009251 [Apatococcus fuscideae]|uniref:Acireductone dioxygenase n=1 Tax=Apatococcus fuscideae TaxID=2026836 RepID=A0AAW1TJT0_9CHLO
MEALCEWATAQGVDTSCITIGGVHGRELVATRDIRAGGCFVSVPQRTLLQACTGLSDAVFGPLLRRLVDKVGKALDERYLLCLTLLIERCKGPVSSWSPYLDILPKSFEDTFWWCDAEHALLKGTSMGRAVKEYEKGLVQLADWRDQIAAWCREAYGDAGHMESWQSGWGLTERATRWARSVVWSRAFRVPLGEQGHGLALVPFADMLDHDPNAHIAWHAGFTGADDFQMVTFSPISKGSVLCNNYGFKSNEELLLSYGFMLPNNLADFFHITLSLGAGPTEKDFRPQEEEPSNPFDNQAAMRHLLLAAHYLPHTHFLRITTPLPIPLLTAATLAILPEPMAYAHLAGVELQTLARIADGTESQDPTPQRVPSTSRPVSDASAPTDWALLGHSQQPLSSAARMALEYRARQKGIAQAALTALDSHVGSLLQTASQSWAAVSTASCLPDDPPHCWHHPKLPNQPRAHQSHDAPQGNHGLSQQVNHSEMMSANSADELTDRLVAAALQAIAGEELPVQQQGLLMELMANLAGSFAACLACGGAQADLMSDDLQVVERCHIQGPQGHLIVPQLSSIPLEIRSLALEVAWSSDGSCVEARAAVPLQAGLHLCQGLLLPGSEAEEVLILAGSACLAALHHAQQTGIGKSAPHFSYPLSLAPPEDDDHTLLKQALLERAGWLQSHHLHSSMTQAELRPLLATIAVSVADDQALRDASAHQATTVPQESGVPAKDSAQGMARAQVVALRLLEQPAIRKVAEKQLRNLLKAARDEIAYPEPSTAGTGYAAPSGLKSHAAASRLQHVKSVSSPVHPPAYSTRSRSGSHTVLPTKRSAAAMAPALSEEALLAEAQSPDESKLDAWYMDDDESADQRSTRRQKPNQPAAVAKLRELGVLSWALDADKYENDPKLEAIRKVRGYSYQDIITVSPEKLPGYEEKLKMFFEEHIHTDEEIRYILEGSGYFDVRDKEDRWIRVDCRKGDMIVLPEGIYHRFTLDADNYVKAMRLFIGEPVWTPLNRPQDSHQSREKYIQHFGAS